jgi:hypothetical protein
MAGKILVQLARVRMNVVRMVLVAVLFTFASISKAQDEETEAELEMAVAEIKLSFSQTDTSKTCKAVVMSGDSAVKETEVRFYVRRSFSLLPIDKAAETDENGEAFVDFPMDLPGDENGMLYVVAKIEEDDTYGTVESAAEIKWGVPPEAVEDHWGQRSLSASRDKAPMYLIIVSNLIIATIWGVLIYIIFQVYRIKKAGKLAKK